MGKKSNVSEAQRREAVLSLLRREESAAKLARRLGVSEPTLYAWRDKFIAGGMAALSNGRNGDAAEARRIKELERAVQERDQVVGELTIANRILKKLSDGSQ
jgi:transposase-like protein